MKKGFQGCVSGSGIIKDNPGNSNKGLINAETKIPPPEMSGKFISFPVKIVWSNFKGIF